jgi:hypothetical protein
MFADELAKTGVTPVMDAIYEAELTDLARAGG